ncbi:hypothetical protein GobsT_18160 [Gemmata obscuriglobus]|uniref:Uncharacterized protein n=1 Tax=Gemmata obscuriglobus TaxID=114 RepID=A0A2Z3H8G1_9BACT|nr:hypothetical protein [Gemmata obscuriglobus]AWM39817.1 hypothetical protein C1280_24285 [Gemmata obscuriglobus]QEG27063.1 hypothetical protein GobsT_18160 [Gemmata obscuriglobus]VTS03482.1 unnamed protein product [Gemmata obscuriglobus UQM 2246]
MFLKAPFGLPADFLRTFGYPGQRRYIGLYWSPMGDEACWDDGQSSACGLADNHYYLAFIRRKEVLAWRDENGLHLGNSEEEAQHWLVVDAETCEVYAAHWREARQAVIRQEIPS